MSSKNEANQAKVADDGFIIVESKKKYKSNSIKPPVKTTVTAVPMTYNPHYNNRGKKKNYIKHSQKNYKKTKFVHGGGIRSEWKKVDQVNIVQLEKKTIEYKLEDYKEVGYLREFDRNYQLKLRPKTAIKLKQHYKSPVGGSDISDDPVFVELMEKEFPEDCKVFFMDDVTFTALSTMHKSNFPFNVHAFKYENKFCLFIKDNDDGSAFAAFSTYDENVNGNLPETEAELGKLCLDTTMIETNFGVQCLKPNSSQNEKLGEEEELEYFEEAAEEGRIKMPKLYSYKKLTLNKNTIVYVRTTIDAYETVNNEQRRIMLRTFNNTKSSTWIKKWETQKSIFLTDAYQNNSSRVLKWITQAYLSGVNVLKIGFVVKAASLKTENFKVISVEDVNIKDMGHFFGFNNKDLFGCLSFILDRLGKVSEDCLYAINKTPFENNFTIFEVPNEEEGEEEEGEEEENEDE